MDIKDFCTGIQHIGIPTNNMKETITFYEQLGFHVALLTNNQEETVAFLQMHNLMIETYENNAAAMQAGAIDHIALDVKRHRLLVRIYESKEFSCTGQPSEQTSFLEKWSKILHRLRA